VDFGQGQNEKSLNWESLLKNKKRGLKNLCSISDVTPTQLVDAYTGILINKTNLDKKNLFVNLLNQRATAEEEVYLQKVCNLPHKDNRTPVQYATDLVVNWLFEDLTSALLTKNDILNKFTGADSSRQFLSEGNITSQSDFRIKVGDVVRNLEVVYDHTNYWFNNDKIDLRLNKHEHLKYQKALLLGIDSQRMQAFVLDYNKRIETEESFNPRYGKVVHTINGITNHLSPIGTIREMITK
jgi:hypothetical protein